MQSGIVEDSTCKNNTIVNNNINYFVEHAVHSEGNGTLVTGNVYVQIKTPAKYHRCFYLNVVPQRGLEPPRP